MSNESYKYGRTTSFTIVSFQIVKTIGMILKIRSYALIAVSVTLVMAAIIPILTLAITGRWIYDVTSNTLPTLLATLVSYMLSGAFVALLIYFKRNRMHCRGGAWAGVMGTTLSAIGCCSPVIYGLFVIGIISSAMVPFLSLIPPVSILLLGVAICLLADRIRKSVLYQKSDLNDHPMPIATPLVKRRSQQ